jgi:hypothetical protein
MNNEIKLAHDSNALLLKEIARKDAKNDSLIKELQKVRGNVINLQVN